MKIVDEYWPMIYGEDRKVLLSDLLYLIAARAKELFNYDIDVVQMTILALLLTDSRSARRRARSILPKAEKGEALRSLRTLLRESTYDEPEIKSATDATRKLMLELVKIKQDEKAKDDDDARAKKRASGNFQELVNYLGTAMDKLIGQSFGSRDIIKIDGTDKSIEDHAADYNTDIKAKLKEMLDAAGDEYFEWFSELKGLGDMVKYIRTLIEKYKELSPEIQKVAEGLIGICKNIWPITMQAYIDCMSDRELAENLQNIKVVSSQPNI